jgi:CheY-like chemotaxis protein
MEELKSPANILLVDDDSAVLNVISLTLKGVGYHVVTALDGKEALVKIFADPSWGEREFPDLILADIMMPVMDGFEFCEKVKRNPKTRGIPFIFLTAKTGTADRARGLFLGCQCYLTKPCRRADLLRAVNQRLVDAEQTKALLADSDPVIDGDLAKISVFSLVDLFSAGGWSGKIYLSKTGEAGSLEFYQGEVVRVSWGKQEKLEALKPILELKEGSFRLERLMP